MPHEAPDDDVVMSLVEMALARPPDDREAYLQSACAGNSELFGQVWNYVESDQRMHGFLLEPLYPPAIFEHPFEPGELLDGRFRIVREVAQGGMGIVYEAMDEKLERRIALKCAKIGFRKRLPPEVRNASEISHPNVCKIFEIHTASTQHGEIDFLTMEFLDGETLADRLRRKPLPEEEARTIALQLCAGLAEAHRKHVIHGDLKSNNVILTTVGDGSLRAVVTDFGLAQRPEAPQRTAQSGQQGGTPAYMAPELWMGGKASIASDIYALGVILYELASGRRPEQPEVDRGEWLAWKPPAVHPKWDRILQRCLDPDPLRRFRDADEVAQALAPSRTRRWLLAAAAAAVLAIVTGGVTYQTATTPTESVRLAMLPFESGQDTAPLAERLSREAAGQLARLKGSARTKLAVIPLDKTARNKVDTTEKARIALGATHVLHGTLTRENDRVILHAYLTDARSLVNTKAWKVAYAPGELRYGPVALAGMVTGTFRLPTLVAVATVNSAARQDYLNGLSYLRRDTAVDAALASFERAVAADPDSPLTYAGLAEAQWFKYFLTKDRAWLDRSAEAERQAERRNPDLAPVHRVAGLLRADAGFYELAAAEYRRAIELEPGNGESHRRLGQVYERNNQLEEALISFQQGIEVQPGDYRLRLELGAFEYRRANYLEAIKHLKMAADLAPEDPNVHRAVGSAYLYAGRFSEAEQELRLSIDLQEMPAAVNMLGLALVYEGRDPEAVPYFLRALNLDPQRYLSWLHLGIAYRRMGLNAESERANRQGLELAEMEMARNPRSGYVRSFLAYMCARLRDRQRAESEIAQALQLSPNQADTRWMAALTYEALGRREATLAVVSASASGLIEDLSRWPDVADLHKDSRFIQLLASRRVK